MHLSKQEAQEDITQLVRLLIETHPDPYSGMGGPLPFHRAAARMLNSVPQEGMTDIQILRLLRPFVADVQDGHTTIYTGSDQQTDRLPAR